MGQGERFALEMRARMPDELESRLLEMPVNLPVLVVDGVIRVAATGDACELLSSSFESPD